MTCKSKSRARNSALCESMDEKSAQRTGSNGILVWRKRQAASASPGRGGSFIHDSRVEGSQGSRFYCQWCKVQIEKMPLDADKQELCCSGVTWTPTLELWAELEVLWNYCKGQFLLPLWGSTTLWDPWAAVTHWANRKLSQQKSCSLVSLAQWTCPQNSLVLGTGVRAKRGQDYATGREEVREGGFGSS